MVVALLVKPVGAYLERVFERRQTFLDAILLPIERWIHRLVGVDCRREMDWKRYSLAFGMFGAGQHRSTLFRASLAGRVSVVFSESSNYTDDTGSGCQHGS